MLQCFEMIKINSHTVLRLCAFEFFTTDCAGASYMLYWASHWRGVVWLRCGNKSPWSSYMFSNMRNWCYGFYHIIYTGCVLWGEIPPTWLLIAHCWRLGIPCKYGIWLECWVLPIKKSNCLYIHRLLQL